MNQSVLKTLPKIERDLWKSYIKSRTDLRRNRLLEHYWLWVKSFVYKKLKRISMADKAPEALSFVSERLLDAIVAYSFSFGVEPKTYFVHHISGAIKDSFRSSDFMERKPREVLTTVRLASNVLANKLGHRPTDSEVAEYLGWQETEVIQAHDTEWHPDSITDEDGEHWDFLDSIADKKQQIPVDWFRELTKHLTHTQRHILYLRYIYGLTTDEIAEYYPHGKSWVAMRLSESKDIIANSRKN